MVDIADMAAAIEDETRMRAIFAARAAEVPAGVAGECERCGEDMPRLVAGLCAPCRDGRRRIVPMVRTAAEAPGAAQVEPNDDVVEEVVMERERVRQINFRASGPMLDAIERAAGEAPIGATVLALIERGLAGDTPPVAPEADERTPWQRAKDLTHEMLALLAGQIDGAGDVEDLKQQIADALKRAETAERKLAGLRELLS